MRQLLRQDVQIEPLIHGWYAWSHLVSPATAAMHVVHGHLRLMKSYAEAPEVHRAALENPAMLGGPFLDLGGKHVEAVRAHIAQTESVQAPLIELAAALKSLDEMLTNEGTGASLEPLYPRVPEALRGYVELHYDVSHRPGFRLFEPLLYRSRFYNEGTQEVLLSRIASDERPFVLSTPRMAREASITLPMPFRFEALDALVAARAQPVEVRALGEQLRIRDVDRARFASLFEDGEARPTPRYEGEGVRVRYFGHACVLLETREVAILIDPTASYKYPSDPPRFTYADFPERIDYVVMTHNHQDHVLLETLLQLRSRVGEVIVPRGGGRLEDPSLRLALQAIGFARVREVDALERVEVPGGSILALPFLGEHADLAIETKAAFLVELGQFRVGFFADSNNLEPRMYEEIRRIVGDIPNVFLGMECEGA